jgi:virginiamycin B lyase
MAAPAVVAVGLFAVVIEQGRDEAPQVSAGEPDGIIRVDAITLPDDAAPWSVAVGSDQAIWVLSRAPIAAVVRMDDGEVSTIALPEGAEPDVLVAGTDDGMWATDPPNRRVLRIATDGDVRTWTTDAEPSTAGAWMNGRFWYAEPALDRITSIAADGEVAHVPVPQGRAPTVVAAGPDGAIWYASSTASIIGSVSSSGVVNELDLGSGPAARATVIANGPGPALWLVVTSPDGARLARVDTRGAVVGDALTTPMVPLAASTGPNGRLWFTGGDGTIHQRSQSRTTIVAIGQPLDAASWALAGDDSMWAVDRMLAALVRIDAG